MGYYECRNVSLSIISVNFIRLIKADGMENARGTYEGKKNGYRVLVRKPEERILLARFKPGWGGG